MKTIVLVLFILAANTFFAQWTFDPANPMLVCNELNYQNGPQSQSDGEGGAYIMWLDTRNDFNKKEVYGQHVNSNGEKLWEEDGRLILTDAKNIASFRFYRYSDGKMIIGWYAEAGGVADPEDKLRFQELNTEGQKVWTNDLVVSEESAVGALSVGYFSNYMIKRDAMGFQVCMMILTYGYDRIRMSRFSEDGNLLMPLNGIEIGPLDFGNVAMTGDGGTGAYIYYSTGNGWGAALMCNHVDAMGVPMWTEWVSVADANGLSYQFSGIGDDTGVTFVWQGTVSETGTNLYSRRLNPDGTFAWGGNTTNICVAPGTQADFSWMRSGSDYYITWGDGRPGVIGYYGIYAQRFNQSGSVLWETDGVEIADLNTYAPYPRVIQSPEGDLYFTHLSTTAGYVIQKVTPDGVVMWDADGEQITIPAVAPNAWERAEFVSGNNLLSVWVVGLQAGGTDGIYMNRIADFTPVTYVDEIIEACGSYQYNDVTYTESGMYEIDLGENTILNLDLTILQPTNSEIVTSACNEYTLNGTEYTESGTYTQTLTNSAGCDSTITLYLDISEFSNSVSLNGGTLTAEESGAFYQWTDCETGEGVGGNLQSFTPTQSGEYSVTIMTKGCSVTSECIMVTVTDIATIENRHVEFYPNPVQNQLTIRNFSGNAACTYRIIDASGRMVGGGPLLSNPASINFSEFASGPYIFTIEAKDFVQQQTIFKID